MEANRPEESREAILGAGLGVLFFLFIANVVFAVFGALGYEKGLTDFLGHMLMAAYAAIVLRLGFAERNYLVPGVLLLAAEAAAFVSVYVIRSSPAWLIVPAAIVSAAGRALEFGAHSSAVSALSPKLAKSWTRVQAAFCIAMAAAWLALILPGTLFAVILGLAAIIALVLVCAAAAMYLRFSYKLFDSAAE